METKTEKSASMKATATKARGSNHMPKADWVADKNAGYISHNYKMMYRLMRMMRKNAIVNSNRIDKYAREMLYEETRKDVPVEPAAE